MLCLGAQDTTFGSEGACDLCKKATLPNPDVLNLLAETISFIKPNFNHHAASCLTTATPGGQCVTLVAGVTASTTASIHSVPAIV